MITIIPKKEGNAFRRAYNWAGRTTSIGCGAAATAGVGGHQVMS